MINDVELDWLDLKVGVPTEVKLLTVPHLTKIHAYMSCPDGRRNFGCRSAAPEGCYFCQFNKAVPFAFAVCESAGQMYLWQMTRSIIKKAGDVRAGDTVVIRKLDRAPWTEILGVRHGEAEELPDAIKSIPERVARSMGSLGYHIENAWDEILEFINSGRREG